MKLGVALAVAAGGSLGQLADCIAASAGADAGAPSTALEAPLVQPLPRWEEPDLPPAEPAQLVRVDALIEQLLAPEHESRVEAIARVRSADASLLPALVERFERLATTTNKPALKVLLEKVRDAARAEPSAGASASPRRDGTAAPAPPPDLLELIASYPDRSSSFLRPLTELVAYSRMFEAIGTLPAARRLVSVFVRFGEFMRADTVLALERMQDGSIAALIEATAHPVPRIAEWAKKQLEDRGKLVASEAIQVQDPTLRADILRAYGKTRDVETGRLLISFAASDRALIRLAARQAVTMLGEPGTWQLRDAYEKAVGRRAPREWSWERVAAELFAELDRQRLSELYRLYGAGRTAAQGGDLEAARKAFDQVLALDPLFERGPLMAETYLAIGDREADTDPEAASLALRRAERLSATGPIHDQALSLRLALEATALAKRGLVDTTLVQRARALDPKNQRAANLDAEFSRESLQDNALFQRYIGAAVILAACAVALLVMSIRRRRESRTPQVS